MTDTPLFAPPHSRPASSSSGASSREDRLAAKLRENLRRRKAQARALGTGSETGEAGETGKVGEAGQAGGDPAGTLPKAAPSR